MPNERPQRRLCATCHRRSDRFLTSAGIILSIIATSLALSTIALAQLLLHV